MYPLIRSQGFQDRSTDTKLGSFRKRSESVEDIRNLFCCTFQRLGEGKGDSGEHNVLTKRLTKELAN